MIFGSRRFRYRRKLLKYSMGAGWVWRLGFVGFLRPPNGQPQGGLSKGREKIHIWLIPSLLIARKPYPLSKGHIPAIVISLGLFKLKARASSLSNGCFFLLKKATISSRCLILNTIGNWDTIRASPYLLLHIRKVLSLSVLIFSKSV